MGRPLKIKLDIWDTAGEEAQAMLNQNFFHGAHAIIIVYAIDKPTSFKSVSNYYETVEKICPPQSLKVIVGNKCDLDDSRRVTM